MNLSVVLILRLLLTDLMRPPLDHIKHAGLEKFGREFVIVLVLLPSIEQNQRRVGMLFWSALDLLYFAL